MQVLLIILLLGFSFLLFYQDYSSRQIHLIPLLIFIGLAAVLQFEKNLIWKVYILESLLNLVILGIVLLGVFIYARFIRKKEVFQMIGIGDLVLFLAFVIGYESAEFIIHFTIAMIFSLVVHLIMKSFYKKHKTVPLAGYMAIFFSFDKTLSLIGVI